MSAGDQDLFGTMIKVENKDIFVDLKKNGNGLYLKLSERNGKVKNTVLIPASGIGRLKTILEEVAVISAAHAKFSPERKSRVADNPEVLARSVYVSGLAWTTSSDALVAHFQQIGHVEKAAILYRTRRGKSMSLGCGVVEFSTPAEAALAVTAMTATELDGRSIRCREDRSVDSSSGEASFSGERGLLLPTTATPLVSARKAGALPLPPVAGAGALHATTSPSQQLLQQKRVQDPRRVFITSLPFDATQADVLAAVHAVGLGAVSGVEILVTRKGRSLGHAVVEFADVETAARAVLDLNGREVQGRAIIVRPYYRD